jgi:hypothetical protein
MLGIQAEPAFAADRAGRTAFRDMMATEPARRLKFIVLQRVGLEWAEWISHER